MSFQLLYKRAWRNLKRKLKLEINRIKSFTFVGGLADVGEINPRSCDRFGTNLAGDVPVNKKKKY